MSCMYFGPSSRVVDTRVGLQHSGGGRGTRCMRHVAPTSGLQCHCHTQPTDATATQMRCRRDALVDAPETLTAAAAAAAAAVLWPVHPVQWASQRSYRATVASPPPSPREIRLTFERPPTLLWGPMSALHFGPGGPPCTRKIVR